MWMGVLYPGSFRFMPVVSGDIHEKVDAAIRSRLRVLFDEVLDERDGSFAKRAIIRTIAAVRAMRF